MTLPAVRFYARVLLMPVAALGCDAGGDSEPVDSFAVALEARAGVPFAREGAVVSLEVPDSVAVGSPVPIRIRVTNETSAPLDLYLRGREITFDITVADSSGNAVWRRLEGQVIPAIVQIRTLAPGETLVLDDRWDQISRNGSQVPPGGYLVRGEVLTDGERPLEGPGVPLEIRAKAAGRGRPD